MGSGVSEREAHLPGEAPEHFKHGMERCEVKGINYLQVIVVVPADSNTAAAF